MTYRRGGRGHGFRVWPHLPAAARLRLAPGAALHPVRPLDAATSHEWPRELEAIKSVPFNLLKEEI